MYQDALHVSRVDFLALSPVYTCGSSPGDSVFETDPGLPDTVQRFHVKGRCYFLVFMGNQTCGLHSAVKVFFPLCVAYLNISLICADILWTKSCGNLKIYYTVNGNTVYKHDAKFCTKPMTIESCIIF